MKTASQEMAGGQFLGFGADVGNITTSAIETVIGTIILKISFWIHYSYVLNYKMNITVDIREGK